MIDTVKIGFPVSPTEDQLKEWWSKTTRLPQGIIIKVYWTSIKFNGTSIRVDYYPQDLKLKPNPLLLFTLSLPYLVYGNNIQMIADPSPAIRLANSIIKSQTHIPTVDLFEGILYRIDLCYNFKVGEHVGEIINQLFKLEFPHRKTKPYYPTNGVQFYSTKSTLTLYDKEEECKDPSAHGLLRAESSWRDKYLIGKLVGKRVASIRDFTLNICANLLNIELKKAGVYDRIFADPNTAFTVLAHVYGPDYGMHLFGHLCARQTMTRKEMLERGISRNTIYRHDKDIRNAGLVLSMTNAQDQLPQLVIDPLCITGDT